jgi:uncharacterized membrane-anchored protein
MAVKGLGFYSTAAQVIPVLVLVVGFQIRGWAARGWFRWVALAEFILCLTAETHSLAVLHAEKENAVGPALEYSAINVLFVTIGAALFPWWYGHDPTKIEEREREAERKAEREARRGRKQRRRR